MTAPGRGHFARGFAGRFAMGFAPRFTVPFAPVFAPALAVRCVLPGQHSYEWNLTATTCGWYGGKSVRRD